MWHNNPVFNRQGYVQIYKLFCHQDLVHKLINLMWNDWHTEVRNAAAQTLGKTCHGKDVHDELRKKILSGSERERVEAISKVGHLGEQTLLQT